MTVCIPGCKFQSQFITMNSFFNCMMVGQASEAVTELLCLMVVFGWDHLGSDFLKF